MNEHENDVWLHSVSFDGAVLFHVCENLNK